MATTTNYSWSTPDDTGLVKDGASNIRTLGSSVDTTLFTALGGNYAGLRLIKKQTIGSGVSSVTVTGAFSATYENYKIIVNGGASSSASGDLQLTLTGASSNYAYSLLYLPYTGTVSNLVSTSAPAFFYAGSISSDTIDMNCDLQNPFLTKFTTIKSLNSSASYAGIFGGQHKSATSYTGFTLTPNGGTLTGGTIYVYGYGAS